MEALIRDAILELLPEGGGAIGNKRLLAGVKAHAEAAGWTLDEATFLAVKAQLIADGVLAKGRGRGGSVYRAEAGAGGSVAATPAPDPDTRPGSVDGNDLYGTYRHNLKSPVRPDVGVQDQFAASKRPRIYRYDSPALRRNSAGTRTPSATSPNGC